jgi:hypothetical protein
MALTGVEQESKNTRQLPSARHSKQAVSDAGSVVVVVEGSMVVVGAVVEGMDVVDGPLDVVVAGPPLMVVVAPVVVVVELVVMEVDGVPPTPTEGTVVVDAGSPPPERTTPTPAAAPATAPTATPTPIPAPPVAAIPPVAVRNPVIPVASKPAGIAATPAWVAPTTIAGLEPGYSSPPGPLRQPLSSAYSGQ